MPQFSRGTPVYTGYQKCGNCCGNTFNSRYKPFWLSKQVSEHWRLKSVLNGTKCCYDTSAVSLCCHDEPGTLLWQTVRVIINLKYNKNNQITLCLCAHISVICQLSLCPSYNKFKIQQKQSNHILSLCTYLRDLSVISLEKSLSNQQSTTCLWSWQTQLILTKINTQKTQRTKPSKAKLMLVIRTFYNIWPKK